MFENVTVAEAISRGKRMISWPVLAIMFGTFGFFIFLGVQNVIPASFILVGFAAGFILGWVYWSFAVTKWRLWAFDNVRNVHELQRKAVESQIIWPADSFFEKTEIRSAEDKAKWESLQSKFDQKDVYVEDVSVPNETLVYYSKGKAWVLIFFMIAMAGAAIYLYFFTDGLIYPSFFLGAMAIFMGYSGVSHLLNKNPQIVINDKGIETAKTPFTAWADIAGDEVITRRQGKSSITYFEYTYPGGSSSLSISDLDINKTTLENLLHTYRVRSEKKASQQHSSTPIAY